MSYILKYTNACLNSNEEANTNVQWEELLYKNAITSDRQLRPRSLHQDNNKKKRRQYYDTIIFCSYKLH